MSKTTTYRPSTKGLGDFEFPRNEPAEKNVIGAIMLDPSLADSMATKLKPEDFFNPAHAILFRRLVTMVAEAKPVDLALLVDELQKHNELTEVGDYAYLGQLMSDVPVSAHVDFYADSVKEASIRRKIILDCQDGIRDALDKSVDTRHITGRVEDQMSEIHDVKDDTETYDSTKFIGDTLHLIDRRSLDQESCIWTGFRDIDKLLSGMHGSELIILAARPGMGKTALALNIAEHVAIDQGVTTAIFSLEMKHEELGIRMISARYGIYGTVFKKSTYSDEDIRKIGEANSLFSSAPLIVNDKASISVSEIGAICRMLKRKNNLGFVVIDYLGLIEPEDRKVNRQEQVSAIVRRLKILAKTLDIPVLCLSQLNRGTEMTRDFRPRLTHLRESGSIEQDADVVLFIHRDDYYKSNKERGVDDLSNTIDTEGNAIVIVAKQRNGPVGDVPIVWESCYTRFKDVSTTQAVIEDNMYADDFSAYGNGEFNVKTK